MNKMNMPGFTAGASLYPSVSNYRTFSISNVPCDAVVPQMTKQEMADFLKSLIEGGSGGSGGSGGGGGSTGCMSDCLAGCFKEYFDCMRDPSKDSTDRAVCKSLFPLCNWMCLHPVSFFIS